MVVAFHRDHHHPNLSTSPSELHCIPAAYRLFSLLDRIYIVALFDTTFAEEYPLPNIDTTNTPVIYRLELNSPAEDKSRKAQPQNYQHLDTVDAMHPHSYPSSFFLVCAGY